MGVVPHVDLKDRTRAFALAIIGLVERLPRGRSADVVGMQLLRAGRSVGANYRAACRARSRREFLVKLGIVEEEADEARQLVAITVASIRTARRTPRSIPHSALRIPH